MISLLWFKQNLPFCSVPGAMHSFLKWKIGCWLWNFTGVSWFFSP